MWEVSYRFKKVEYYFIGLVPAEVKEKMIAAQADFQRGCILVLADERTAIKGRPWKDLVDPLIVGFHDDTPDLLWLIAAFDLTPLEQMISERMRKPFEEALQEST